MELLTGAGLASAAGLNAWLPLLVLGLVARTTDLLALPDGWAWLAESAVLVGLGALLLVETLADKVPGVDSVNDVLQTAVRPLAGGVAAGAGTGVAGGAPVTDLPSWLASVDWGTVVAGAALALAVHLLKAAGRAGVDAATLGIGAPVASVAEDALSLGLVASALLAPLLVLVALALLVVAAVVVVRLRGRRGRAAHPV
ncbi:DUF4126 domain-containing protein [uncultured Pseudokineococcus sp.]|uniref:DUF4126 domain-containing protein n=1 Tax=uncultured Pseudokineococcus sp. TaxID=1642928 RepID=UPI0026163CE1|nr:DUF4126 domain-containing protein [uncultured Pseudokineococcus sp.]